MEKSTASDCGDKRKREEEKPAEEEMSWARSKCSSDDSETMTKRLFLQSKGGVRWRSALGEVFPSRGDSKIFLFTSFLEHDLSLLVHFCEAFLGIKPHFEFFQSLYTLTPLPSADEIGRMGCVHLQLHPKVVGKYLEWAPIHVDPDWKDNWFYISNPALHCPSFLLNHLCLFASGF